MKNAGSARYSFFYFISKAQVLIEPPTPAGHKCRTMELSRCFFIGTTLLFQPCRPEFGKRQSDQTQSHCIPMTPLWMWNIQTMTTMPLLSLRPWIYPWTTLKIYLWK
ncbi:Magnetosome protein MamF [Labeo rohita]|uniref:Magnetosome protein MamF n=1 Tax=Labeo rohita TaxID=84645 RepID=A0ABQ8LS40_LABRO|nr:Magnetosome protein MamF [Labeo rohita]